MRLVYENSSDYDYRQWYLQQSKTIVALQTFISFSHGNFQKSAILINILRWQILVINLYNKDVIKRVLIS